MDPLAYPSPSRARRSRGRLTRVIIVFCRIEAAQDASGGRERRIMVRCCRSNKHARMPGAEHGTRARARTAQSTGCASCPLELAACDTDESGSVREGPAERGARPL